MAFNSLQCRTGMYRHLLNTQVFEKWSEPRTWVAAGRTEKIRGGFFQYLPSRSYYLLQAWTFGVAVKIRERFCLTTKRRLLCLRGPMPPT